MEPEPAAAGGDAEVGLVAGGTAWTAPEVRAKGRKLMFHINGSRGDVQPVGALSMALQASGFIVRLLTNVNHVEFLRSLGLDAIGVRNDSEAMLRDDPVVRELVAKGDAKAFAKKGVEWVKQKFPEDLRKLIKETKEFQPDAILCGQLDGFEARIIGHSMAIPVIGVLYAVGYPSRDFQTSVMHRPACVPFQTIGTIIAHYLWSMEYESKASELEKQLPEGKEFIAQSKREFMLQVFHPCSPVLAGYSPSLISIADDWSEDIKARLHITGFWTIPKEMQERKLDQGDSQFGGDDRACLEEFLARGEAPVYMGWGSMVAVSPEHMAHLAVGALAQAKLRGIILGGYARLEPSLLQGQKDSGALAAYAQMNVLFVRTAAHEWLFPQCAAIVHHGGSGTCAASIRSGVPSVVTPCAFDQFDNAQLVQSNGLGVAMKQFSKVQVADLAKALKRCTTDQKLIHSSRKMGERLRSENGVEKAVHVIDDFLVDEVDTGAFKARLAEELEQLRELRSQPKRCCSTARWFGKMCCSSSPNEYSVKLPRGKAPP